jgi:predicted nucleotidyltransferase component of viral defense system
MKCYSLEEILSEKLRSLIQRPYPGARDYYDIWWISSNTSLDIDWQSIIQAFAEKAAFKNVAFNSFEDLFKHDIIIKLKNSWNKQLIHQIPDGESPDFEIVLEDLKQLFQVVFK